MDVRDWIHKAPGFMFQQVLTFVLPLGSRSAYVTAFHNHWSQNLVQGGVVEGGDAGLERRRRFLRTHCFIAWGDMAGLSSIQWSSVRFWKSTQYWWHWFPNQQQKVEDERDHWGVSSRADGVVLECLFPLWWRCQAEAALQENLALAVNRDFIVAIFSQIGKYLVFVTIVQGSEGNTVSCQICSCGTSTKWKIWLFFFRTWSFSKSWRGCGITWHRYFTAKFFSSRQEYDERQEWPMAGHYSHAYFVKQQSGEIIAACSSSFGWPKLT